MKYRNHALLVGVLTLSGCAMPLQQTPPPSVQVMPTDCANRVTVINWLEQQSRHPRQSYETQESYEKTRAEIRHRIWNMRYRCQPV
jgi:hypothetical protein